MKKVLLISPPWYRIFGGNLPSAPLGLCYIGGVLEQHGYEVSIYNADARAGVGITPTARMTEKHGDYLRILKDMNHHLWKEAEAVISEQSPDIVGVSVTTAKYGSALNVSKLAKDLYPGVPVIWGGVHPTILPAETIKNEQVDIVVRGEGEYTFLDLIQNLDNLDKVKGITYKENGKIIHNPDRPLLQNLDELPFPAKHLIVGKGNYSPEAFGNIFTSRGCPYNCTFCAAHKIWTKKVRYRSPQNVIGEIKQVQETFKTRRFTFEDDSFNLNKNFVDDICQLLIEQKLNIKWGAEGRADLISDDLIKKMKSAGCEEIIIGVESGDEETLRRIKKGIAIELVKNASRVLRKNKMRFSAFFMIGFPWETEREIHRTIALMKELDPHRAVFSIATPYPGTELYALCKAEGLLPETMDWSVFFHQSPDMYLTRNLTRDEVIKTIAQVEAIFERHNARQKLRLALFHPGYAIGRLMRAGYYHPRDLWTLLRHYILK